MDPQVNNSTSAKTFMEAINQSYSHLLRSLLFFSVLIVALAFFFQSIVSSADVSAEFNKEGRLIITAKKTNFLSDENRSYTTFLLPSNAVWFDTGLELKPEQECVFKITGRVHLAVQRIVESASSDSKCPIPWTDANGNSWADIGDTDAQLNAKKQLLLKPGDHIGNVVGYYLPEDETNQFQEYFTKNRSELTTKIFDVGNSKTVQNTNDKTVRIYLSVNDVLLGFNSTYIAKSEMAYCGSKLDELRNNKWLDIKRSNYDNLYFDDNIGSFLVQVEIRNNNIIIARK
jgi:hypothetical protein